MSRHGAQESRAARLDARLEALAGGRARLAALALILALGLGLRVGFAIEPLNPQPPDARGYARIAESLYNSGSFEQRGNFLPSEVQAPSNYSPGLPLLTAAVYELRGGVDLRLARITLAVLGSLAILFTFLIGRRLAGPTAGLIGAAAVAVYPSLLEYQGMLMTEPLAATLLSGAVLAVMWASQRERPAAWALPGLLTGALAMVRPEYLLLGLAAPLLALVLARRGRDLRAGATAAAVMALAFVVVLAPWTIRNLIVLDRFVPLSTGGGKALFIGTRLPTDGDGSQVEQQLLETRPWLRRDVAAKHPRPVPSGAVPRVLLSQATLPGVGLEPRLRLTQRFDAADFIYLDSVLDAYAARRHPEVPSDVALARLGRSNLIRYARERPLDLASMLAGKVWEAWRYGPRNIMEGLPWAALHAAVVVLGLLGLAVLAWRRRWEAVVFGVVVLAIVLMCALLIASPRRVVVALPLLAALGGSFLVWAWAAAAQRRRRPA
jgi:hypothetical protein